MFAHPWKEPAYVSAPAAVGGTPYPARMPAVLPVRRFDGQLWGNHGLATIKRLLPEEESMANGTSGTKGFGITIGGALVIAGIVIAILWSLIIGIIVAVVGLVAFGGFVRGRWY